VYALIVATALAQSPPPENAPKPTSVTQAPGDRVGAAENAFLPFERVDTPDGSAEGLPPGAMPERLTWERVHALSLARPRASDTPLTPTFDPKAADALVRALKETGPDQFRRDWRELVGDPSQGDPADKVFELLALRSDIIAANRNLALRDQFVGLLRELIAGEGAGIQQIDLDRSEKARVDAILRVDGTRGHYRNALDAFKPALGLSPKAAVAPDLAILDGFFAVFREADAWHFRPDRKLEALPVLGGRLPALPEIRLNGRSLNPLMIGDDVAWEAAVAEIADKAGGVDQQLVLRKRLRRLGELARSYEANRARLVLSIRLVSNRYDRILQPSTGMINGEIPGKREALMSAMSEEALCRGRLVARWVAFQRDRLALYRDLGEPPAGSWKDFLASLTTSPGGR